MTAGFCNRLMSHLDASTGNNGLDTGHCLGDQSAERMIGGLNSSPDSRMPQYFIGVAG